MNVKQISDFVKNSPLKKKLNFAITSADKLHLYSIVKPTAIIVNTDMSDMPGSHWVCFYFPEKEPAEFFDSLGERPNYYHKVFEDYLIANGTKYLFNIKRIQDFGSSLCGQYCLYFLLQRTQGITFEEFLEEFDSNYNDNDTVLMKKFDEFI